MQYITSGLKYLFRSQPNITLDDSTLVSQIFDKYLKSHMTMDAFVIEQLKKLEYYSLNLTVESNKFIISKLNDNMNSNQSIVELCNDIKNSDAYDYFLKEFYYRTNRCTELLKTLYSNNLYLFLRKLTYDELLILLE